MKVIASRVVISTDIGLNSNLFGATLLGWLDKYGALYTYRYLHHTFVTYKMDNTYFKNPAKERILLRFLYNKCKI